MDPNAWQAYHQAAQAYTNRFGSGGSGGGDEGGGPGPPAYHNPALSLLAASQHYQHNSLLPPSLLAAQQHKSGTAQSLANHLLTPSVTPASTAWASDRSRHSVIEAKSSQPAFPGQPPPLQDARRIEASSPAFPGQPPPRQSSQPRSQVFPGSSSHYSQQESPGYSNNYSPAPSPGSYNVQSPQEYHSAHSNSHQRREERERQQRELERQRIQADIREKQKEKERQERLRIAEERREQERIRQEQEFRREQERIRQEKEKEERIRKEQEERKRREREKQEQERRRREEEERRRREEERRKEEERRREQERIRQEQERIAHERKMQEERDLGLARLSAMGALNDLGEENNGYNNQAQGHYEQQQEQSNFNINMFNQYQQNMIKQEQNHEQKPLVNQFSNWINRANELLDLSSSDSRETSQNDNDGSNSNNFIPQILMNPWDPQTPPMMTFAPIANAMQQYQQQWLSQYQQAAGMLNNEDSGGSFPLGRFKVLCIAPDEDMGFLINLPPPCNLLFQQEALVSKKVASPFIMVFQKFIKDPDLSNLRKHLTEAPDKPPPYIEPEPEVPKIKQEIKREYVPPYTPKATQDPESKAKLSQSGYSRALEVTPVRRTASSRSQASSRQSFSTNRASSSSSLSRPKPNKKNVSDDEDELPEIRMHS